jgi:hypothetical protein
VGREKSVNLTFKIKKYTPEEKAQRLAQPQRSREARWHFQVPTLIEELARIDEPGRSFDDVKRSLDLVLAQVRALGIQWRDEETGLCLSEDLLLLALARGCLGEGHLLDAIEYSREALRAHPFDQGVGDICIEVLKKSMCGNQPQVVRAAARRLKRDLEGVLAEGVGLGLVVFESNTGERLTVKPPVEGEAA